MSQYETWDLWEPSYEPLATSLELTGASIGVEFGHHIRSLEQLP